MLIALISRQIALHLLRLAEISLRLRILEIETKTKRKELVLVNRPFVSLESLKSSISSAPPSFQCLLVCNPFSSTTTNDILLLAAFFTVCLSVRCRSFSSSSLLEAGTGTVDELRLRDLGRSLLKALMCILTLFFLMCETKSSLCISVTTFQLHFN